MVRACGAMRRSGLQLVCSNLRVAVPDGVPREQSERGARQDANDCRC
ncbi:hypothetical protein [Halovenus sp. HT40]